MVCPICKTEFESQNRRRKYCNPKCKTKRDSLEYYKTHAHILYLKAKEWRENNRDSYLKNHRERMRGDKQRAYMKIACKKYSQSIKGITKILNLHVKSRGQSVLEINYIDVKNKFGERNTWKCGNCGKTDNLTIDHIKAFSLGGENIIDNIQVLCRSCNSSKGGIEKKIKNENKRKLNIT